MNVAEKGIFVVPDDLQKELFELSKQIHDHPELGLQEHMACKLQCDLLQKYGFEVEQPFGGFETAYRAVYKGKKKGIKIAMLAEYDALPEIGHACGHNLIAMVSVGSALAMKSFADTLGAEIYVFGTPAEETIGTKVQMSNNGFFDDMDVVMMAHPANINADCSDTMAINGYKIAFKGRTAHAAAAPEEGLNALDAMINFFNLVNALRQQTKSDARIHGIITSGGVAPNIIPDYTEARFYVRANRSSYLEELCRKVEACARGAAIGTGTEYEMVFTEGNYKDTRSNRTLAELNAKQMEKLGIKVVRTAGTHMPVSSDLGDVSYHCPAIQCSYDITEGKGYSAHTVEFEKCAGSEAAMEAALRVICAFVQTGIQLMSEKELIKEIKEEFESFE